MSLPIAIIARLRVQALSPVSVLSFRGLEKGATIRPDGASSMSTIRRVRAAAVLGAAISPNCQGCGPPKDVRRLNVCANAV